MFKKGLTLLLLCFISTTLFASCTFSSGIDADITGNGKVINNSVGLSSAWSSVEIEGIAGANVYLSNEQSNSVKYSIDEDLEKYIDITEKNGTLIIKTTSGKTIKNKDNKGINFYIGTNELKSIKSSTFVKLEGQGTFSTDDCSIELVDASSLTLDLDCNNLQINMNGAGSINLKGKGKIFNAKMAGAGKLLAKDFKSTDVILDVDGISESEVYAENILNVTGDGAFKVTYWGNPQISQDIDGIGSVEKGAEDTNNETSSNSLQNNKSSASYTGISGSWIISKFPAPFTSGITANFNEDRLNIDSTKEEVLYTSYNFENLIINTDIKDGLLNLSWEDPNNADPVICSLRLSDDGKKMIGTYTRYNATVDIEFSKVSDTPNLGDYKNTIYTRAKALLNEYSDYKDDGVELNYTYNLGLRDKYQPLIDEYKLDELTSGLEDTELMIALMNWVCNNFKHDGAALLPEMDKRDAISLIDFYKTETKGLNCRGLSIILSEICNLYGVQSRYITCMDETALEAHVVAEAYSKKYNQWIMLDPTNRLIAKDKDGNYLNLQSLRKIMAAEEDFFPNSNSGHNDDEFTNQEYKEFISKFLFAFNSVPNFTFNSEMTTSFYALLPDNFDKSKLALPPADITLTTSDSEFWKLPTQ